MLERAAMPQIVLPAVADSPRIVDALDLSPTVVCVLVIPSISVRVRILPALLPIFPCFPRFSSHVAISLVYKKYKNAQWVQGLAA